MRESQTGHHPCSYLFQEGLFLCCSHFNNQVPFTWRGWASEMRAPDTAESPVPSSEERACSYIRSLKGSVTQRAKTQLVLPALFFPVPESFKTSSSRKPSPSSSPWGLTWELVSHNRSPPTERLDKTCALPASPGDTCACQCFSALVFVDPTPSSPSFESDSPP